MKKCIVRLLEITIKNLKNVKCGNIVLNNSANIRKEFKLKKADILGIYGQNGSGKTALVEAMDILKSLFTGEQLEKHILALIADGEMECVIETTFFLEFKEKKYLVYYEVAIEKIENELVVARERLSCSIKEESKWKAKTKLIDYDLHEKDFFTPAYRYKEITSKNKEAYLDLNVAKELSKKSHTSFIFSEDTRKVLHKSLQEDHETLIIRECLAYFAKLNLYVITNQQLGVINMSQLLPFNIRLENSESVVSGNFPVKLFETFVVPEKIYKTLRMVIKQINIVLGTIIPDLTLDLFEHNRQYLNEEEVGIQIELLSVRQGKKISLRNESDGIKKIISILSTLIAMYNQSNICVVIDELDSGIFEYLLGELLEVLDSGTRGQLIFTSHNLRALEKLNKESIVFTTANPNNRYIRLENVKSNNNLRDFYLRGLSLGGQKEIIYQETDTFEMQYALRKAGKIESEE